MMKKRYLALAFIAATSIFAPMQASALSVNAFEKQSAQQQTDSYNAIVKDTILEAYKINNQTGIATEDFFTKVPTGASETKGYTAFDAELRKMLADNKATPSKLNSLEIEDIIFDVFQTYVLPNVAQNTPQATLNIAQKTPSPTPRAP